MTYVIMTEAGCTEVTKASNTREQVYCFTDENYLSECVVTALFTTILFTIMLLNKQLFDPRFCGSVQWIRMQQEAVGK